MIMSNIISLNLEVKQPEDVKKIAEQATKLLNLLNPKGKEGVEFGVFEKGIYFEERNRGLRPLIAWIVTEGIAASFPDMDLTVYTTWEGPVDGEYVSDEGWLVEVEPLKDENGNPLYDEAENILFP